MPRRFTAAGVVRASMSTLASAAALQALSQPSMSNQGGIGLGDAEAAGLVDPLFERGAAAHAIEDHLGGGVQHAGKAVDADAGQALPRQAEHGRRSMTEDSKRNSTSARRASFGKPA